MLFCFSILPLVMWISTIDICEHRIPNRSLIILSFGCEIHIELGRGQFFLYSHLFAVIVLLVGSFLSLSLGGAIGMGDVKLFALLALLIGHLQPTLEALLYSCVFALIWTFFTGSRRIPFAPPLFAGYLLTILV